jgi:hypothetical protein
VACSFDNRCEINLDPSSQLTHAIKECFFVLLSFVQRTRSALCVIVLMRTRLEEKFFFTFPIIHTEDLTAVFSESLQPVSYNRRAVYLLTKVI